jgi:hypothetical protein
MRNLKVFSKKIVPVFLTLVIIWLPLAGNVFAAIDSGYLSPNYQVITGCNGTAANTVDSNLTTSLDICGNGSIIYNGFTTSDTLNAWFSAAGSGNSAGQITFFDSKGAVLSTTANITVYGTTSVKKTFSIPAGTASFKISSISAALYGPSGWGFRIHEVEVNTVIVHNEISNLAATTSGNSVTINYTVPTNNSAFVGTKIYREGTLIATLGTSDTSYTDKGMAFDTKYTYKITATYNDGYETAGLTNQITTGSMPHGEITNLGATVSYTSANLSWSIPNNQYLVGFKVYRNNVLIKTFNSIENTYEDDGLASGVPYSYTITSLYSDGYETKGVTSTFTTNTKPHDEVSNLNVDVSYNSAVVSWIGPTDNPYLVGFKVYRDNKLVGTMKSTDTFYQDNLLTEGTSYTYKVDAIYDDGYETSGQSFIATLPVKPHDEVTNLKGTVTYHSVSLSWTIPNNIFLVGFNVYRDNQLIKTLDATASSYEDDGLDELTSYHYTIISVYDDSFATTGISDTFTTIENPVVKTVGNATAEAVSYKQINLSWNLPNQHNFQKIKIYRAEKPKKQGLLQAFLGAIAFADTTPTEIFETNGTYFNDLTVQPDTSYQYSLTTATSDGRVSNPITVSADTPTEPMPVYTPSGTYSVNQNGDYVFKWTQPTLGTVKILVGDQTYQTVDASQQQITIPKTSMKTTVWGDPSVSMIPVGEFGSTGKTYSAGGNSMMSSLKTMPLQSNDLLATIVGILGIVAPFILLTLAIYYFKPIKRSIENAALRRKEGNK